MIIRHARASVALLFVAVVAVACSSSQDPRSITIAPGCNPLATSDECALPMPSAYYLKADPRTATKLRVSYPPGFFGASASGKVIDTAPYDTADGFSPSAPILLHFAADVDVTALPSVHHIDASLDPDAPIAILNADTGERVPFFVEMDANRKDDTPDRYAFILRPQAPLAMGARHVVVLTDRVKLVGGRALPASPAFAALRDREPTTSDIVESMRPGYESLFTFLASKGYAREHLALAWDFTVASEDYILSPLLSMREQALATLGTTGLPYVITSVAPSSTGGQLVEGDFEVPNFLTPELHIQWDAEHHPVLQTTKATYPFTMIVPRKAVTEGKPLPLVIFGHGLFGTGRDYLAGADLGPFIQGIAETIGAVLIATDWIGLSGTDDSITIGLRVGSDLNQLPLVTDRLTQSVINNLALTKLARGALQSDPQVAPADHPLLDLSRTYYYGVSLGGIQGATLVSISDDISRAVLAVPGCAWATMLSRSTNWTRIHTIVDPQYPDPLQQQVLTSLIQAGFDFTDGVNVGKRMLKEPMPGAPEKNVLLLEAIGDSQVPNLTTEMLARALGVKLLTPSHDALVGIESVGHPTRSPALAQYYLPQYVDGSMPPDTNVPQSTDNGAHFNLNKLPNVQEQIQHFIETGEVEQYCSAECRPD
jgi:hypothetical protein